MNKAIQRIINKDLKSIEHYKLNEQGIYIEFNENNMLEAYAMIIGPKNTLYEGGYLFFNINFPKNYPYSPPDVSYVSRGNVRIHPNLYVKHHKSGFGKVCLSILGTWNGPSWSSIMDINTVLITIQSLLDNNPLIHEPGCNSSKYIQKQLIYKRIIKYNTIKSLIIDTVHRNLGEYEIFRNIIDKTYNKQNMIEKIEILNNEYSNNEILICGIYRMKIIINIDKLKKNI